MMNLMTSVEHSEADSVLDRYAIPIAITVGPELELCVGTGFMGEQQGEVALYTAAHCLAARPMRQERLLPIDDWSWLHDHLDVYPGPDHHTRLAISIFTDENDAVDSPHGRRPAFGWTEAEAGLMFDAAKFELAGLPETLEVLTSAFGVVDLDSAEQDLCSDDELVCLGFPPKVGAPHSDTWPYDPPAQRVGPFLEEDRDHLVTGLHTVSGFSGGPAFTAAGKFAGMVTGGDARVDYAAIYPFLLGRLVPPRLLLNL